jgi:hypothetical protein
MTLPLVTGTARRRRDDVAFRALLHQHLPFGLGLRQLVRQDVHLSLLCIDAALRHRSGGEQLLGALEFDHAVLELGVDGLDAGIGGLELQRKLVVNNGGDDIAGLDGGSLFHGE